MAAITSIYDIAQRVETDLSDAVLLQLAETASQDVHDHLPAAARSASFPVTVWTGIYQAPTSANLSIAYPFLSGDVDGLMGGYPAIRILGTFVDSMFHADSTFLANGVTGTSDMVPVTREGAQAARLFRLTMADNGALLLSTTRPMTVMRVYGYRVYPLPAAWVSAGSDLGALAAQHRIGLQSERVGQYSMTAKDYHRERAETLKRVKFASGATLVA